MSSRIRVGRGRTAVMIEGALAGELDRELRKLLGPVADRMQQEADQIIRDARSVWPIKTGRSRDSWETVLTVLPGTFEVEVSMLSDLKYVRYILSTKVLTVDLATRRRSPLQAHVRKPARAAERVLKKELPAILGRALQEVIDDG